MELGPDRDVIVVSALAFQIIATIIFDIHSGDEWERGMGILGIAVACGTIAVPILHKVSAIRVREAVRTTELSLAMICPRCGKNQTLSVGRSKCCECGLGFSIEIEEENCKKCGYPLYKIESAVCPECGTPIFRPAVA
jgi:ribosomal protein L37E